MKTEHTPGPIKLYHHKTSGGAEYLMDKFVVCPNGDKEGVIEGAEYIVRLDGSPELSIRNGSLKEAAPDLLKACQKVARIALSLSETNEDLSKDLSQTVLPAIAKATE